MAKHKSHQRTMLGFVGKPGAPTGEPPEAAPPEAAPPAKPAPAAGAKKADAGDDVPTEPRPGSPEGTKTKAGAGALRPGRHGGAPLGASRAGRTKIGGSSLSAGAELLKKLSSKPHAHAADAVPEDGLDWGGETGDEPTPAVEPPAAAEEAIVVSPVLDIGEPASPEDDDAPEDLLPPGAVVKADAADELLPPGAVVQAEVAGGAEAPVPSHEAPGEQPATARGSGADLDDLFVGLPLENAGETPAPLASMRAPSGPGSVEQPPMTKTSSAFWMVAAGAAVAIGGLIAYFLLTGASEESVPADAEPTASAIAATTAAEAPAEPSATASATASASASASAAASASASAAPSAKKPPTARPPWWKREDIYE